LGISRLDAPFGSDGLPAHYTARAEPPALTPMQRLEAADRFFAATGADIRHAGTRAYYAQGPDYVQMPPFETFRDAESYAASTWSRSGAPPSRAKEPYRSANPSLRRGRRQPKRRINCAPGCVLRCYAGERRRAICASGKLGVWQAGNGCRHR
jgi:hypothetical protein